MVPTQPVFSIIVPTYNRPTQLAACIAALARLDYPHDRFEVIIVDDGSALLPDAVIAPFHNRLDISMLQQTNAGPGAARNMGASRARGRIFAFTDDDCTPHADWLQKLAIRYASTPDPVIIGGTVLNALPDNRYAMTSQLIVEVGYAYHNSDPDRARFFTANNLAIPADRFHELGGFDVTYGTTASEDRELCGRWQHHGYRMIYAPEVVVEHAHTLSWNTFCRQHFNYGRGAIRLQQARVRQGWRLFSPDPHYYRILLQAPFARFPVRQAVGLAALLFTSQAIMGGGMVSEWIRQRREKLTGAVED
jgi:glycosyltransferase involved in cell wall biosynthesis